MKTKRVLFAFLVSLPVIAAWEETCTQFKNIYQDGTELCEKMWADSFEVVDDSQPGYTMWFFDQDNNPNDATTRDLFGENQVLDQCHLKYFHKDAPGPEGNDMAECHPWKNNACCDSTTVKSVDQLNEGYGDGYQWDRCGPMSEACERFFVMEACLYECEPSAGLFRKYNESEKDNEDYNEWQLHKMPIKKSFCDSWHTACSNDYFCGTGDYFECAAYYEDNLAANISAAIQANITAAEEAATAAAVSGGSSSSSNNTGLIIGLSIVGVLAAVGLLFAGFLVSREKQGNPVFSHPVEAVSS